ncbi:ATP-dependent Lon protase [Desulfocurvibacter africanus PCS]|uniref:endopeptidase La n=1 Tax=Desulfocurvibacter africanus PCS TaxID=1262666 RepID=M5Q0I4_DESAF|nr:S16 family serine protease [Desulfocurvibacter africanus]EMG36726.1 ATP-dependent Lon protase [Desulfocurvibacter africanus PCS]
MPFFRRMEETAQRPVEEKPEPLAELRKAIAEARLPEHARQAVTKELERLDKTDPSVAEYSVGYNWVQFVLALPWNAATPDNLDLARAERVLNEDHFGLSRVKERVLEHLAASIMVSSRPRRVLVVDDERIALDNMAYVLGKDGHEVLTAENGRQAMEVLARTECDLVITDLKMNQMDGLELLERLKAASPQTELILVTGFATVDTAVNALKKGAAHYLPKPLNLDVLRSVSRDILDAKAKSRVARGPILCFSGPPGTGKTSIGRGVAAALGRKFIRLSMAGLRDEAELRGHRRTYVGAMPGRILAELKRAEVNNPVFMLDEVDKIGKDFRGDPASVLLEVLDPEQNRRFLDYYLDMPFDLSGVMFITTANVVEELPRPLYDRMEAIPFQSYTPLEKRRIARDYIAPRQMHGAGLRTKDLSFTDAALDTVIDGYTREAGLRNLDREIGSLCRKVDLQVLAGKLRLPASLDAAEVTALLGPPRFRPEAAARADAVGVATGLVYSEYGGQILFIETARMAGGGGLMLTGSLGEVLKESAQTALSYIRSRAGELGIAPNFFKECDIHVHIPAGAIPKDGPSAGVTIAVALVSLLSDRPARSDVAMTGEMTLSGRLLPVGGLREKLLAAQRAGVMTVVLPKANEIEWRVLDEDVRQAVRVVFAETAIEAIKEALQP